MRTSGDTEHKEDTSVTTYAGGIVIAAILLLAAIRGGLVNVGK